MCPGLSFQEDFEAAADLALRAGAVVVEANLSCPNVGAGHGALYLDAATVHSTCKGLVAKLGPEVPLIIKVGRWRRSRMMGKAAAADFVVKGMAIK